MRERVQLYITTYVSPFVHSEMAGDGVRDGGIVQPMGI